MPLYEYQCLKCNQIHEQMQKFSDAPLSVCPNCGGDVKKLMSLSSFTLKGSGWYSTDYKKASSPASSTNDTPVSSAKAPESSPEKVAKEATSSS